ncbi:MAG: CocE/NonD family hydrolase [Solirubrobacteraceae bacterium]
MSPTNFSLRYLLAPLLIAGACLVPAAAAQASGPTVLSAGGGIPCAAQSDGVEFCQGSTVPGGHPISVDGTIIDANVTLPSATPPAGGWPLVIVSHGYGGGKKALDAAESPWLPTAHQLALRGYAVLNATDRGFGESCGSPASRAANLAGCATGWLHLMDARYEVRDAQQMAGMLADEGFAAPSRIGAIGESYGGGESLMLGTLKDRVMDAGGHLQPWLSPLGKPMSIAAATPTIPWSDLISSLVPNGHGLDYTLPQPSDNYTPEGVLKQSFVGGLYAVGATVGYYAPPGLDPSADLTSWNTVFNAGEPYEANPLVPSIIDQFRLYRSALHVLDGTAGGTGGDSEAPAPMLLSSGFTDDLFPVDETLRYYNVEKSLFPAAPIALSYLDYGHMRGQNKPADTTFLAGQINAWLDHYVLGTTPDPGQAVTALTQTCPKSAPSGGPYTAASWPALHPGTLQYDATAAQTLSSLAGNPATSLSIDPISGQGACASVSAADDPGVATYRLPAATGGGFTMIGAPTIVAQMAVTGAFPEIAGRLWDVAPDGTQTLVDRGDFRPTSDTTQLQFFQLHPGAWHFDPGHLPKLELLGRDAPYVRASNGQFTVNFSALRLYLPTLETSGNAISVLPGLPAPPGSQPAYGAALTSLTTLPALPSSVPAAAAPAAPVAPVARVAAHPKKHPRRCHTAKKHHKHKHKHKHKQQRHSKKAHEAKAHAKRCTRAAHKHRARHHHHRKAKRR